MATQVQFRRGNTAQVATFTGANGEVIVNYETNELVVQDGVTQGGHTVQLNETLAANVLQATANNTLFVGTVRASNVVSNAQLQANLANYLTITGVASNVAPLTVNSANYIGGLAAPLVVSNAQLQGNLANYPTNINLSSNLANYQLAGLLAANVLNLTSNNSNFIGGLASSQVVSNAALNANLVNYATLAGLSSNVVRLTANDTLFVGGVGAANVVSNAQLAANLSFYASLSGLASNVVRLTANNALFVDGVPASLIVDAGELAANLALYTNTAALNTILENYQQEAYLAENVARLTANDVVYVGGVFNTNVVSNAQLQANLANYGTLSIVANAYSNAVAVASADATSKATIAYSNAIADAEATSYVAAAEAYSNAVATAAADASTKAATAFANAIASAALDASTKAGTAYANAIAWSGNSALAYANAVAAAATDATTKAGTAYANAVVDAATDASTKAGTAYANAVADSATDASTKAGTAYSNAVAAAATDATTKAGTAYANAVADAATDASTKAGTAYSNAVADAATDASTKASTAYSNAVADAAIDASTKAGAAYVNAVAYANSIAINLQSIATDIIPATDNTHSLGNSTNKWQSLYVSANTIYFDSVPFSVNSTGGITTSGNVEYANIAYVDAQAANAYANALYTLPAANTTVLGGVIVDGVTIVANATGGISANVSGGGFVNGQSISVNTFAITGPFDANGTVGIAGQVLVTNGNGVYWEFSNGSGGTFTNGQSISVNVISINAVSANGSLGIDGQFLASNGTHVYWSNVASSGGFTNGQSIQVENLVVNGSLTANGELGTPGYVLASNGTGVYWTFNGGGGTTNVDAQYTWTNSQTFTNTITFDSIINGTANNVAFVGSVPADNVVSNSQLSGNLANYVTNSDFTSNVTSLSNSINDSYTNAISVAQSLSDNAYSNAVSEASILANAAYQNAISAIGGTYVTNSQLQSNLVNYAKLDGTSTTFSTNVFFQRDVSISGNLYVSGNVTSINTSVLDVTDKEITIAYGSISPAAADGAGILVDGANVYWRYENSSNSWTSNIPLTAPSITANVVGSVNGSLSGTFTGVIETANQYLVDANTAQYIGTVAAANVVTDVQLSGNLAGYVTQSNFTANLSNYQTAAGLAGNVLTLTSNSAQFIGNLDYANVVSNAQLQSNLTNYASLSGLASNVLMLTAAASFNSNNSAYFNGQNIDSFVLNANLATVLAPYQTISGLASEVSMLSCYSSQIANVATNAQLANNSSYLEGYSANAFVNSTALSANLSNYTPISDPIVNNSLTVSGQGQITAKRYVLLNQSNTEVGSIVDKQFSLGSLLLISNSTFNGVLGYFSNVATVYGTGGIYAPGLPGKGQDTRLEAAATWYNIDVPGNTYVIGGSANYDIYSNTPSNTCAHGGDVVIRGGTANGVNTAGASYILGGQADFGGNPGNSYIRGGWSNGATTPNGCVVIGDQYTSNVYIGSNNVIINVSGSSRFNSPTRMPYANIATWLSVAGSNGEFVSVEEANGAFAYWNHGGNTWYYFANNTSI